MKNKLLILTGPQGSGNHLFAKLFSMSPAVEGWPMAKDEWQGHHKEPFADCWEDPSLIKDRPRVQNTSYLTSISCPYVKNQVAHIPKYYDFITEAKKYYDVVILLIGRDKNILQTQQQRVRGDHTTPRAITQFKKLYNLAPLGFISQELFYLYGIEYLESIARQVRFPFMFPVSIIDDYIKYDANKKYIKDVKEGFFDGEVKKAINES